MNIYEWVASSYIKKAGIFEAPPRLVHDVSDFIVSKYAGHILAITEKKIAELQGSGTNYTRLFEQGKNNFVEAFKFLGQARDGEVRDFMIRPDINKALRIKVEEVRGYPHFSYTYVKNNREGRGSRTPAPVYKFRDKLRKIGDKEIDELYRKKLEQDKMGDPDVTLVELTRLRRACLQYTKVAKTYKNTARATIAIDLRGWDVLEREGNVSYPEIYNTLEANNFSSINVVLHFKGHVSRGGVWKARDRELQVDGRGDVRTVKDFQKAVARLIQVSRHECQHVGQSILGLLRHLGEAGGLPSKSIRDPRYDESGVSESGRYRRDHALQDVEFYTRIADEVEFFIRTVRRIPVSMRRDALRLWVGDIGDREIGDLKITLSAYFEDTTMLWGDMPRGFFRALQRSEPEKWRKAVKEFVSEVQGRLRME